MARFAVCSYNKKWPTAQRKVANRHNGKVTLNGFLKIKHKFSHCCSMVSDAKTIE